MPPAFRRQPPPPPPGDEPAFRVDRERALRLPRHLRNPHSASYLAHRVARAPTDLHAHVQRIHLHLDLDDREGACAALTDLFIALGDRGTALRARLLTLIGPRIPRDARMRLAEALKRPLEARSPMAHCTGTVLSQGLVGDCRLVEWTGVGDDRGGDTLEQADTLLRDGQLDAATRVLESALAEAPRRSDILPLLLEIYRRTRDAERFNDTCDRLLGSGRPLPREWLLLADELAGAET